MNKLLMTAGFLLVLAATALTARSASAQTNFGSLAIGSNATQTVTVNIQYGGTLSTIEVLTGGGANLDFNNAGGGSCTIGKVYANNSSCTVKVSFQPKIPGARYGGVTLAVNYVQGDYFYYSGYVQGIGLGAQTSFSPESPVLLGSVPNLSDVQSDGRGYVFYTAAGIGEGGNLAAAGSRNRRRGKGLHL